jgi:hypothetical protein
MPFSRLGQWQPGFHQLAFEDRIVVRCWPDSSMRGVAMSAMKQWVVLPCVALFACTALGQTNTPNNPTWWNEYQYLSLHSANGNAAGVR